MKPRFRPLLLLPILLLSCSDNAAAKKDGSGAKKDGPVAKKDGPATKKDGPAAKKDKAAPKPDKAIPKPDKAMPKPDKAVPKPDKAVPKPDSSAPVGYSGSFPKNKTGYLSATLTVGGYARPVSIYRPTGTAAKPPVMITFHGTNGDAKAFIAQSYAKDLADQKKVIIISPSARKPGVADWDHQYNNEKYWQSHPYTKLTNNPDLKLVQAIIQEVQKAYAADPKRIYTLGHSSGGFFSLLAAMTLPTQIAGFAEGSGGLTRCTYMWSCKFTGSGSANTCAALSAQSGYSSCLCSGAYKPGPVYAGAPKPAAYLFHHTRDTTVSSAHTCMLQARLKGLGYKYKTALLAQPYHSMPYNFALNAWAFLSNHKLP